MLRRLTACAAVLALAVAARYTRLAAFDAHQRGERYEDVYYLPPAEWLPALSLGYTTALADLLWCRSLVYFGVELSNRGVANNIYNYTDAILALDPDFRAAYRWAATGSLYRPIKPTREEAERGISYLRRAVERWPHDGELRWDLGSFARFELVPLIKDPEERARIQEEAAEHLHVAAVKGAGPAWLALNNSTLLTKLGKKEVAIRQLEEVFATVEDEEARGEIAIRLAQLRSETESEALRAAVLDFEQQRQASFPYVSGDLFLLVGPKVSAEYQRQVANRFLPASLADEEPPVGEETLD